MLLPFVPAYVLTKYIKVGIWWVILFAEEEESEIKKSKLYRPATKFVPVSQHSSPTSLSDSKKSVSWYSLHLCCVIVSIHFQIFRKCTIR